MFTPLFWRKVGLDFARTFVAVFVLGIAGAADSLVTGDLKGGSAALLALLGAAVSAGIRAAQAQFTKLETPPA